MGLGVHDCVRFLKDFDNSHTSTVPAIHPLRRTQCYLAKEEPDTLSLGPLRLQNKSQIHKHLEVKTTH